VYLPTVLHPPEETHDIPPMALKVAPDGLGVVWIVHSVPFHCSAKVT